ncbi:MAG: hypothetical protein BGP06_20000 [Rhizobiales bacterium 65-9]|nr:phosphodiester glycosidase family protein [Hyphomicrobiales bacterium]OJY33128.1 MAG: hypothetical protein BGP06_20000 [Rhizobiales bacterium 65-9]
MRWLALALAFSLIASREAAANCAPVVEQGRRYEVCAFPANDALRLFWKDGEGKPYGGLDNLARQLSADGETLVFGMNAGMYEADLSPVGLYIENGRQLKSANLRNGAGNFHLKPNGVFFFGDGRAGVMETSRFVAAKLRPRYATQSGPMLVIGGRIHPKIRASGTSEKIRNGVGVRDGSTAIFAISREPVTFHAFASLFRDRLKTPDALFLDGSVSSLFARPDLRLGGFRSIGPIIGVVGGRPAPH